MLIDITTYQDNGKIRYALAGVPVSPGILENKYWQARDTKADILAAAKKENRRLTDSERERIGRLDSIIANVMEDLDEYPTDYRRP